MSCNNDIGSLMKSNSLKRKQTWASLIIGLLLLYSADTIKINKHNGLLLVVEVLFGIVGLALFVFGLLSFARERHQGKKNLARMCF